MDQAGYTVMIPTSSKPQASSHTLQFLGDKQQASSAKLFKRQATSVKLQAASVKLQAASDKLFNLVTFIKSQAARSEVHG